MKGYLFLVGLSIVLANPMFSQIQLGSDIDGEAAGDFSGWPVSISSDGTRVIIGASLNDGNGDDAGHARVFEFVEGEWEQIGSDIDGEAAGDQLGRTVAISGNGNRIGVGAPLNDTNGTDAGQVRIYDWTGDDWEQIGASIEGVSSGDHLGGSATLSVGEAVGEAISFSLDGDRVAIGAYLHNGNNSGHARVFDLVDGNWIQVGSDLEGTSFNGNFGSSVRLSSNGNRLAVSAPGGNDSAGYVEVYDWVDGDWEQVGSDIVGEYAWDKSGGSLSISADGNRLAIGSPLNGDNGSYAGQIRIYELIGNDWVQLGSDIDGAMQYSFFGWSVALSGDGSRVAVGAPGHNQQGDGWTGSTSVYTYADGEWMPFGVDIIAESSGDFLGHSISLSADGSRLATGAKLNDGNGSNAGHVMVFGLEPIIVNVGYLPQENLIEIVPNPTSGKFRVDGVAYDNIRIMNNQGEIILRQKGVEEEIELTQLPKGIYYIQVNYNNRLITKKIIKH